MDTETRTYTEEGELEVEIGASYLDYASLILQILTVAVLLTIAARI